ncbi:hypothetical protein [Nonomuraea recticatena]|uniref:hypothetical protein n=1 Tax=Nonomuraea recticatena TaxID=46178 RepID=UPI0031FA0055
MDVVAVDTGPQQGIDLVVKFWPAVDTRAYPKSMCRNLPTRSFIDIESRQEFSTHASCGSAIGSAGVGRRSFPTLTSVYGPAVVLAEIARIAGGPGRSVSRQLRRVQVSRSRTCFALTPERERARWHGMATIDRLLLMVKTSG